VDRIEFLSLGQVIPGDNDRQVFDERKLRELADSIKEHGLAQPITVRPVLRCELCGALHTEQPWPAECATCTGELEDVFQIVAGERRFRAHQLLERETIKAIVRADMGDEEAAAIMLAENVHRVDLNPLDEAHAYAKRIDEFDWSVARVAREANVSEGRVAGRLKLLELHSDAQDLVANDQLPLGHAEDLAVLDHNRQLMAIRWMREQQGMPSRKTFARVVGEYYEAQVSEAMFDLDALFEAQVVAAIEETENGRLDEILPTLDTLPGLPTKLGGIGKILDAYVAELVEGGHEGEARVMMDFWVKLMGANYGKVAPLESDTLRVWQAG